MIDAERIARLRAEIEQHEREIAYLRWLIRCEGGSHRTKVTRT